MTNNKKIDNLADLLKAEYAQFGYIIVGSPFPLDKWHVLPNIQDGNYRDTFDHPFAVSEPATPEEVLQQEKFVRSVCVSDVRSEQFAYYYKMVTD